jgi:8-oxo-dGTP pyrophosphatase MutT (NUDIX family)
MPVPEHVARLRAFVGHELLLIPSVSVIPVDAGAGLLLVRHRGHGTAWDVLGGAVEPAESPAAAAVREAREEIGTDVRLLRLLGVLGGPAYEVRYPNGDRTAYVTSVYEAEIVTGTPAADGDELGDVAWFTREELPALELSPFARAVLTETGYLSH